jgi:hypothetical protein
MRSRTVLAVAAALALMAAAVGISKAAGPKDYQFTGVVTEVDAKAKTMSVDKGGDVWEFSIGAVKEPAAKELLKVKKGDKVTVYYYMVAKKIETK